MLPNVPEFAAVYYGVLRAGAVVVPMNPLLKAREIAYYLGDSGAPLIFAWHVDRAGGRAGRQASRRRGRHRRPGDVRRLLATATPGRRRSSTAPAYDTAVILYTSGTTGHPKGAELTHAQPEHATPRSAPPTLLQLGPDDVIFGGLPLFHSFGQTCTLNAAVAAGRLA